MRDHKTKKNCQKTFLGIVYLCKPNVHAVYMLVIFEIQDFMQFGLESLGLRIIIVAK